MKKPILVIVGDSPTSNTGFGKVIKELASRWSFTGLFKEIICYGITYRGTAHNLPFLVYPGMFFWTGSEGVNSLRQFLRSLQSDYVLWILHDPWRVAPICRDVIPPNASTVLYFPVDGSQPTEAAIPLLNKNILPVTYTQYGADQVAAQFGVTVPIIGHGIDKVENAPAHFETQDDEGKKIPMSLREYCFNKKVSEDDFLISYVATNSYRKDPFSALLLLSHLRKQNPHTPFKLYMHMCSNGEGTGGYNLVEACNQLGIREHVLFADRWFDFTKSLICQATPDVVRAIYKASDLCINTSHGEGWCLPIAEAMAEGTPCAVPRHTAFSSLYTDEEVVFLPTEKNAGTLLPADRGIVRPRINVELAATLISQEIDKGLGKYSENGKIFTKLPEHSWDVIAEKWIKLFKKHKLV
jgi:glycosyltransferase involved in cell wall biosynthesis